VRGILLPRGFVCNEGLERVGIEAAGGQIAGGSGPAAAAFGHAGGPFRLGIERRDGVLDELPGDSPGLEVGPDRGVAPPTGCQGGGAAAREALVVDESCARERIHHIGPRRRRDAGRTEALVELAGGTVAQLERTRRAGDGVAAAQLPCQPARLRTRKRRADCQPGPQYRLRREDAPCGSVELDLDAVSPARA